MPFPQNFHFSLSTAKCGDETGTNFQNARTDQTGQDNGSGSAKPAAKQWLHAGMPKEKVRRLMICVKPSAPLFLCLCFRPVCLTVLGGTKKNTLSLVCLAILFCALVDVPTLLTILLLMASLCPCPVLHSDRHLAQREAAFLVSPPIPFTLHPPSHPSASIHRCLAIGAHTLVASSDPYASAHHNTIQRTRHTAPPPAIG